MAALTVCRELRGFMVRVGSGIVVSQVAANTGVGCIVVIAVVTGSTVVGNSRVRPVERIVIVVIGKRSRRPARLGRMATGAVIAKAQRYVIGVAGLIEIRRVAARTGIGCIGIITMVAGCTIIGNQRMASREGIEIVMVESRGCPGCFRMTTLAIGWKLGRLVVRVCCLVKISQVAAYAGGRGIVVIAVVTGGAVIGNSRMCPVERIEIVVVVKARRRPAASSSMTACAIGAKIEGYVVRIVGLTKGRNVAVGTVGGCTRKSGGMALHTICAQVSSGEGERRGVVVKNQIGIARWVAGQTGCTVVDVAIHILMIFIRLRIGVTAYTGEFRVIIGVGVAIRTLVPFAFMGSAVGWKVLTVVVKISWCPCIFTVTACTAGRKSGRCMVRIYCSVIVCQVTAYTGVEIGRASCRERV